MNNIKNTVVLYTGLLVLLFTQNSKAQVKSQNNDIWLHYVGKNRVNQKLSFTLEATMRYANGFSEKQQWFIRPSLDYQFTKKFMGSVGYTHYNTYSYGSPAMNITSIPENHYWIQGTYAYNCNDWKFTHRLRSENRLVGVAVGALNTSTNTLDYLIDSYTYRSRLRYLFLVNHPLVKNDGKTKLFALAGDEVFLNLGDYSGKTLINQNRIIAGFGYNINKNNQVQLSYIHQNIWNFKNTIQESNPTLRVSYITNLDWF
jgi:hypothetical protein